MDARNERVDHPLDRVLGCFVSARLLHARQPRCVLEEVHHRVGVATRMMIAVHDGASAMQVLVLGRVRRMLVLTMGRPATSESTATSPIHCGMARMSQAASACAFASPSSRPRTRMRPPARSSARTLGRSRPVPPTSRVKSGIRRAARRAAGQQEVDALGLVDASEEECRPARCQTMAVEEPGRVGDGVDPDAQVLGVDGVLQHRHALAREALVDRRAARPPRCRRRTIPSFVSATA